MKLFGCFAVLIGLIGCPALAGSPALSSAVGLAGALRLPQIALHTYQLFPSPVAFALYILTTAVTCLLAGYYGALPLANISSTLPTRQAE